jgi:hypothetical protein
LAAIVGLVFWWSPTEGTRRLIPSLVLIGLLIVGLEALRWQAIRDFPEETWERRSERWRASLSRVGRRETAPAHAAAPEDRLKQLERLARLRDGGVISAEELEREKARILT